MYQNNMLLLILFALYFKQFNNSLTILWQQIQ